MQYTSEQMQEILRLHQGWLDKEEWGVRANLTRADLTEADPFGALHDSLVYLLDVGTNTNAVDGTVNDVLFISGRIGLLDATIPVPNGLHEVTLYLMDPVNTGTGARVMDVFIEGALAGDDVDPVRVTGGPYRAGEVTLRGLSVNDGSLTLSLRSNLPDAVYPFLSPERRPILSDAPS